MAQDGCQQDGSVSHLAVPVLLAELCMQCCNAAVPASGYCSEPLTHFFQGGARCQGSRAVREVTPDTPGSGGTPEPSATGKSAGLERSTVTAGSAGLVPPTRVAPWDNSCRSAVPGSFPGTSGSGQVGIIQHRMSWLMALTAGSSQDLEHRSIFSGESPAQWTWAHTATGVPVQHGAPSLWDDNHCI